MNVLKLANISSIIEGNKKPQILSVIHFSSGNPCGLLFLLNRILSVTVILKVITVIIWLSKDNVNVRTQFEAAGTHNEEEYIMTNWKTKGALDNTPCHSQITKKNGGEEKKVKLLLSIQWFLNKSLPCEVPQKNYTIKIIVLSGRNASLLLVLWKGTLLNARQMQCEVVMLLLCVLMRRMGLGQGKVLDPLGRLIAKL